MSLSLPHRRFIIFSGKRSRCNAQANAFLAPVDMAKQIWVGDNHLPHKQALTLLGQEFEAVVYDAFSGLDLNAFAAVCGSIVAGGALILLCPDFEQWPSFADPLNERWAPYPLNGADVTGLTQTRWIQVISNTATVEHYRADSEAAVESLVPKHVSHSLNAPISEDQADAINTVVRVVTGQRKRPAVITADRGRGKSAALGMAIAELAKSDLVKHVALVGGQQQSLKTVFKHIRRCLGLDAEAKESIHYNEVIIEKMTIDELLSNSLTTSLVVVDEAATIGLSRLNALLQTYSRIAFATTVQGYEGSGRGFHLKFRESLHVHSRGARFTHLTLPIRWAEHDPLEGLCESLLLLNGKIPLLNEDKQAAASYATLSSQQLLEDKTLLKQVMALLVTAHYQTSPNDVRYLLDGPNHQLYIQKHGHQVTGVIWVCLEGGFDEAMAEALCLGKRRPRGHLVAEALAAHMGLASAAQSNIARIQRIAIHPQLRRHGHGGALLDYVENKLISSVDMMATSFGADTQVVPFWRKAHYSLVRLSDKQNAASGQHSAIMIKALNQQGKDILSAANQQFSEQFMAQLSTSLCDLHWPLLAELLKVYSPSRDHNELTESQLSDLNYFANGSRPYESTLGALRALCLTVSGAHSNENNLLICKVMQNQSWERVSEQSNLRGRKEVETCLRQQVKRILDTKVNQKLAN